MEDIEAKEKERVAPDLMAAAQEPDMGSSVATEALESLVTSSGSSISDLQKQDSEKKDRPNNIQPTRTVTNTTVASGLTLASTLTSPPVPKPWYKRLNPLRRSTKPPVPKIRAVSREYGAPFLSHLTFQWMAPLMSLGYQRTLELNDIWLVNPDRGAEVLSSRMSASFKRRLERGDRYPLLFALYETLKFDIWVSGISSLLSSTLQVITPFVLRYLISFANKAYVAQYTDRPAPRIADGIGLVIGITIMQLMQSLGTNHFIYRGQMVGAQTRAILTDVIFEKAMKISARAKAGGKPDEVQSKLEPDQADDAPIDKQAWFAKMKRNSQKPDEGSKTPPKASPNGQGWSNGKIVNLMSTDCGRIDLACGMGHMIWTSPVLVVITLVVLLVNISYSALAGFGLLMIGTPLLTYIIKGLLMRRKKINVITDDRVTLTQEILHSVRFVKFFGWESAFLDRLNALRRREIRAIQVLLSIRNAINAVSMALPTFASMLSFITYNLTKHPLDPAPVFSSLALFNSLRLPLNFLPLVLSQLTDAWASVTRIQEFLAAEEQHDEFAWDYDAKRAVSVINADFTWERSAAREPTEDSKPSGRNAKVKKDQSNEKHSDGRESNKAPAAPDSEPFRLHDLDFSIERNELVAVIGGVGSGKSSLLAALAGDMRKTKGSVMMGATRAFCPQYAWIQNSTVKENILFGKDYERSWYDEVVDACALRPDLDMLPHGDQTEIGERGITVSGGQKQRLNIARAIYFDSDLVLLDDPLSAVDAHVGRHIFDHAICGLLKNKCRILATHQLHVLSRCDRIIWMDEGQIQVVDTYENLMNTDQSFRNLMAATAQEDRLDDEPDAKDHGKTDSTKRKKPKKATALMQQEERAVNAVPWSVYSAYIKASGSVLYGPLILLLLVVAQGSSIVTNLWLSWWTSNHFGYSTGAYIGTYAALGVISAVLMYAFSVALSILGTKASRVLLNQAVYRVLRAPMRFFDTTPLGRITNRFAKDVDVMDNNLTDAMRMYFFTLAIIISVFILIIVYFHYFAVALGPLFLMFLFSASYYRASAREMKRHEAVLRSGVYARFGEAVGGVSSIRAYGVQDRFVRSVRDAIDQMDSAYYLTFSNQRWLAVRLDAIGNLLVFTTGILVVTSRFDVNPSIAGLILSYILSIVQMIQFTVRQLAEVENGMTSVERIHYYGNELDEEAPLRLKDVPDSWPAQGAINFQDVQMRYRDGLPLVLQGFNLNIAGGERIGIVGRTGAGKSSIMSTLFRLVELSGGSITIDGVDIATVGLKDLRNRLAIIPQDPTLFRGTIRSNLDPFSEHSDLELWSALRQADLVASDSELSDHPTGRIHLDGLVEDEGLNFSLGQRQMMALARALVRGSQIIVCDEATSSVDMETDQKIQRTMATAFKGKTLLCIAHRLKTIIGYDRICVMDQGRIAELDSPVQLWEQGGIFRGMCEQSGIRREDFDEMKL